MNRAGLYRQERSSHPRRVRRTHPDFALCPQCDTPGRGHTRGRLRGLATELSRDQRGRGRTCPHCLSVAPYLGDRPGEGESTGANSRVRSHRRSLERFSILSLPFPDATWNTRQPIALGESGKKDAYAAICRRRLRNVTTGMHNSRCTDRDDEHVAGIDSTEAVSTGKRSRQQSTDPWKA